MPTEKTSISLDLDLIVRAKEIAKARGFKHSFSAYIAKLIEDDVGQPESKHPLAAHPKTNLTTICAPSQSNPSASTSKEGKKRRANSLQKKE
jgi:hypothetical protein